VTNAIQHSRSVHPSGHFSVKVMLHASTLRVEVLDEGGPWQSQPTQRNSGPDAERGPGAAGQRGRGLMIVAALARWGVIGDGTGPRTVWFEIPAAPPHG
jgi:anti-sigma regulatory factor (Ser/Thr protein kinase)